MLAGRLGLALTPLALGACLLLVPIEDDLTSGVGGADGGGDVSDPPDAPPGDVGADFDSADAGAGAEGCPSADPSLVAWFRFDEDGGNVTRDCSRRQVQARPLGSTPLRFVAGHTGNALDLANVCIEVSGSTDYGFEGKPFTVAAWVWIRVHAMPDRTGRHLVGRHSGSGWHLGSDDPDRGELDIEHGVDQKTVTAAAIPSRAWAHLAATYAPGVRMTLFVNGALSHATTSNVPGTIGAAPTQPLRIGCRTESTNTFDGLADDIRIYDRVLSDDEIRALAAD
jgi:hypothetical protein